MLFRDVASAKANAGEPLALLRDDLANPVRGRAVAMGRHQFQRHVVECEQHAVGAVTDISPRRHARQEGLVGHHTVSDIADQNNDVIEPGNHDESPKVTAVARIFSVTRTGPEYSVIVPSSVFSGTQNSRGPLDRRGTPVMPGRS